MPRAIHDKLSDANLIESILARDILAFEKLYDRHSALIYSLALRILREPALSENAVHDIFLHVWENTDRFTSSRGAFLPLLITFSRNNLVRKLRSNCGGLSQDEEKLEVCECVDAVSFFKLKDGEKPVPTRVRDAMESLNPEQRRAIELVYFSGLTHEEAALELRTPVSTTKDWIVSGLRRLRQSYRFLYRQAV